MANLYEILGVQEEASTEDIKAAYRKLSRRYHPDMTGDAEGHFFKMLAEAHEVLINPDKRAAYDRELQQQPAEEYYRERTYEDDYVPPPAASPVAGVPAAPPIDWSEFGWKNKDFSHHKEKVVLPKPHVLQSTLLYILAGVILAGAALYGFFFTDIQGFPAGVAGAVIVGVGLTQLLRYSIDEKWFAGVSLVTIVANVFILLNYGEGVTSALTVTLNTILLLGSVAAAFLGYKLRVKWLIIERGRGPIILTAKQAKNGRKWASKARTVHPGGEAQQMANNVAEKRAERLCDELVSIPGTRVLSGVIHPGSTWEKVQHIVVNGNKTYLVDALMLPGGKYYWLNRDTISAVSTADYEYDVEVGSATALREFQYTLPEADYRACIILYSLDGNPVRLAGDNSSPDGVKLFTQMDFLEDVGEWFAESPGTVNRGLLNGLISRMD